VSTHPEIVNLTYKAFQIIGKLLIKKEKEGITKVRETEIYEYLCEQQELGRIEGLTFRYRTNIPFSIQVYHVITNLVRKGWVDERNGSLNLTSYGRSKLSKKEPD